MSFRTLFVQIRDLVGPTHKWPRAIQRLLLQQKSLSNPDRFKLIVFLLANGVPPPMIKALLNARFKFDQEALRHIDYIINKYPSSNWRAWNVAANRSV